MYFKRTIDYVYSSALLRGPSSIRVCTPTVPRRRKRPPILPGSLILKISVSCALSASPSKFLFYYKQIQAKKTARWAIYYLLFWVRYTSIGLFPMVSRKFLFPLMSAALPVQISTCCKFVLYCLLELGPAVYEVQEVTS